MLSALESAGLKLFQLALDAFAMSRCGPVYHKDFSTLAESAPARAPHQELEGAPVKSKLCCPSEPIAVRSFSPKMNPEIARGGWQPGV